MKLFKRMTLFLIVTLAFAAACAAENRGNPGPMQKMPGPPSILNLAAELDFTPEQVSKLMAIEKNSKIEMTRITEEFRKLMTRMQEEMDKDVIDRPKVDAIIEKIAANHKAMLTARTNDMIAIKSVLTKEQNKKMKNMFKKVMKGGPGGPEGMMNKNRMPDGPPMGSHPPPM